MVKRLRQRLGLFSVSDRSHSWLCARPDCPGVRRLPPGLPPMQSIGGSGNYAQGIGNRTEGDVLTLADVLAVDLERDRADGAERQFVLIMQAEDVPGLRIPARAARAARPDTQHVAQTPGGGPAARAAGG